MENLDLLEGGPVAVGPLHALVHNPRAFPFQPVHHGDVYKRQVQSPPVRTSS